MDIDPTARRWGKRIEERRRLLDLTQQELADLLGVRQGTISKWERGERRPSHHYIPLIAKTLGTSPEILFTYEAA